MKNDLKNSAAYPTWSMKRSPLRAFCGRFQFIIKHSFHNHTINNIFFPFEEVAGYLCRPSYDCFPSLSPIHVQSSTHLQRKFTCFNIMPGFHWHSDSDSHIHYRLLACVSVHSKIAFVNGFASATQFFSSSDRKCYSFRITFPGAMIVFVYALHFFTPRWTWI